MFKYVAPFAILLTAACNNTEETTQYLDEYDAARIAVPINLEVVNMRGARAGQLDFDCNDDARDKLDWSVSGGTLTITGGEGPNEKLDDCWATMYADSGFELEIDHTSNTDLVTSLPELSLPMVAAEDFRLFSLGSADVTLGNLSAEEVELVSYDNSMIHNTGSFTVEALRPYLSDGSMISISGIQADNVRIWAEGSTEGTFTGSTENSKVLADQNSMVDASELMAQGAEVNAEDQVHILVYASTVAEISAEDDSRVDVFGNPTRTDVDQDDNALITGI